MPRRTKRRQPSSIPPRHTRGVRDARQQKITKRGRRRLTRRKTTRARKVTQRPARPMTATVPQRQPSRTPQKESYRELPLRQSRLKLWLTVLITTAIIAIIWLYFLQKTWMTVPGALSETIENSNINDLVSGIEEGLLELKTTASELRSKEEEIVQPSDVTTSTPTTEELNNLFSDLN